jgi:hypothetical protein
MIGADIDRYSIVPRFRKLSEAYEKPVPGNIPILAKVIMK